jgi:hypothetical protein
MQEEDPEETNLSEKLEGVRLLYSGLIVEMLFLW